MEYIKIIVSSAFYLNNHITLITLLTLVKVITYGPIGSFVIPLEALIKFSSLSLAINERPCRITLLLFSTILGSDPIHIKIYGLRL